MQFRRIRGGSFEADLEPVEVALLATVAADLLQLITADAPEEGPADPLEALVGLSSARSRRPDDPALQRLLPDAYRDDAFAPEAAPGGDPAAAAAAASAEFRRFTEADLRAAKRANADTVLETLATLPGGGRLGLDREQADAWLGFLNDVRLVMGVRLGVEEDTLDEPLPVDPEGTDQRTQALSIYAWLGWVQESLLVCLDAGAS